jgi:predicted nucleic acid-binding protein
VSVVIDASVATKWFTPEEGTEAALSLLRSGEILHAPDLLYAEVANALAKKGRRGEIEGAEIAESLAALIALPIETKASKDLITQAVSLASETGLTVYDGHYLALAHVIGAPLATADRALRRAAERLSPSAIAIWRP